MLNMKTRQFIYQVDFPVIQSIQTIFSEVPEKLTRLLPDNSHTEEKAGDCHNQNEDENSGPADG